MKKLIILLLSGAIVFGAVLTAYASEKPANVQPTLTIGTAQDINNLNLQQQSDQINNICLALTHQPLMTMTNDTGETIPHLAESYEWADDTHLVFILPENACFSNGTPLTADDVVFTFEMALDPSSYIRNNLAGLISIKAIDEHTVEFTTDSYSNEILAALAYTPFGIQSREAYDSGMESPYLIGSGQYKLNNWAEGQYISFVLNENYWGDDPGITPEIIFKPILEPSSRIIALQNGEIDVCIDPLVTELQFLESDEKITVLEAAGTRLFYFGFNTSKEPWDNKILRQAIACAIDRQLIIDIVLGGKGLAQTTILNRGLWSFYDDMEGFDYDVERAQQLIAEAGYPDGGLTAELYAATDDPYKTIAPIIQANLKAIGVEVNIISLDQNTLKAECQAGNQDMFLWRWNASSRLDEVFRDLFYTGSGSNYHHYGSEFSDALTDKILREKDAKQRQADSVALQTYLVEECPQVPLFIANLVIAYRTGLEGTYLFGGGNHYWAHAYVNLD